MGKDIISMFAGLKRNKATFIYRRFGSSHHFRFTKGKGYKFYDYSENKRNTKGFYLCRMILDEVESRIYSGIYIPNNKDNERKRTKTVFINPQVANKYIDEPCVYIDINTCYWTTAYNLGITSKEFYEKGFEKINQNQTKLNRKKAGLDRIKNKENLKYSEKKESYEKSFYEHEELVKQYKIARNAAIGSLGSEMIDDKYVNGEFVSQVKYRRPYNVCRLDIIDHIWNIAMDINEKTNNSIAMFLTDAFFVHKSKTNKIVEILKSYGYECKIQDVWITSVNEKPNGRGYFVDWSKRNKLTGLFENQLSPMSFGRNNFC